MLQSYLTPQAATELGIEKLRRAARGKSRDSREPREKQIPPPGDWRIWLLLAGRGFGKTYTICRFADEQARAMPGSRGAIVGATSADTRDVLIEGDSGLISFYPNGGLHYEPSKRRVTWPNGTTAMLFSADEPERLRGPQFHWGIADELAAWRRPEAWDMLLLGLRLGDNPRLAVATTPKPLQHIKVLLDDPTVSVTRGSTFENRDNLAGAFLTQITGRYEGTRLGRQELYAEILDDLPGALWNRVLLEDHRVSRHPDLFRIVVGVDPAASSGQTGIVVAGIATINDELHGFTLDDATTEPGASPSAWGMAAVSAYHKWHADVMVAEVNNGGDMVENVISNVPGGKDVAYKAIRATRGKYTRAEPIAAIMEQGRDHHVGLFPELEDELCSWLPGDDSPNRLDAKVWALTDLMLVDMTPWEVW